MRQLKNCKVGHFVKYNGAICQVNRFYTGFNGEKFVTLIQVGGPGESKHVFAPYATEKVEYLGDHARDESGNTWVTMRRDPIEEWNARKS